MALVTNIKHVPLQATTAHKAVDVIMQDGQKFLQLDTFGSHSRKLLGKKSQSVRLTPEAVRQLKKIIADHGW